MPILIGKLKPLYKSFDSQKKPKYTINKKWGKVFPPEKKCPRKWFEDKNVSQILQEILQNEFELDWAGV